MVSSNSTGMVHSEQMIKSQRRVRLREPADAAPSIENNSRLALEGVAIVRRRKIDADTASTSRATIVEAAWIGRLAPTDRREIEFQPLDAARADIAEGREQSPATAEKRAEGTLSLRRLCELAGDPRLLEAGDVRLVGWYDRELTGVHADPAGGPGATRDPGDRQPAFRRVDARARRKPATRGKTERALAFSCGRRVRRRSVA